MKILEHVFEVMGGVLIASVSTVVLVLLGIAVVIYDFPHAMRLYFM